MLLNRSLTTYLRVTGLNYDLQVAKGLYRSISRRSYSNEAVASAEMQVNDTQKSASQDGVIIEPGINENSSKLNTNIEGKSSFANRLKASRRLVPLPSSMLRNWEKLDEKLPLNPINFRNIDSKTALVFTRCTHQNIFYGNRLEVQLKEIIPERVRLDPLNNHVGRCVILSGLPWNMDEDYLYEYIKKICDDKSFRTIQISPKVTFPHDTSRWLILLNNNIDSYHVF
ncbi:74_t:CDS:2, partial [Funneliformis geosporum]